MTKVENVVHEKVGKLFQEAIPKNSSLTLLKDQACGGKQHLPLFCVSKKSRANEFCNVDLLVLKNGKIKIIVGIEESNVKPTQVCGKFLTSALAKYFIHKVEKNKPIEKDERVTFIQILDTSKLRKGKTRKLDQWKKLEKSINDLLPLENARITTYRILTTEDLAELQSLINEAAN